MCQRGCRAAAEERAVGWSRKLVAQNRGVYGMVLEFMGIVSESAPAGSMGY